MVSFFKPKKTLFNEVAIADLGSFQIAVLTGRQSNQTFPTSVDVLKSKRIYQEQGWVIWENQTIAHLSGLNICPVDSNQNAISWELPRRLAPSVPISFEVQSDEPMPSPVLSQAIMTCALPDTKNPYHTIFRLVAPRFVRIYPFNSRNRLAEMVVQMKLDEAEFISNNYEYLKQVPFYREHFGL